MEWARTHADRVDVLINNAGGAHGLDTVAEGKDEDWDAMMQSNVLGVLRMTRATLPLMLNHPGSSIINIGSIAGRVAYEGGAAYCAAKAGELQITRALRLELNGTGIRVCTLDRGWPKRSSRWCGSKATPAAPRRSMKESIRWWRKTLPTSWSGWPAVRHTCASISCWSNRSIKPPFIKSIGERLRTWGASGGGLESRDIQHANQVPLNTRVSSCAGLNPPVRPPQQDRAHGLEQKVRHPDD